MDERTGDVYENKGTAQKSTTPNPSFSKEGNFPGSPPRVRRGGGGAPKNSARVPT